MADQWPPMRAVAYRAQEWMDRLNSFCEKHCAKKDSADYTLHVEEVVRSCIRKVIEQNKTENLPIDYFIFAIYKRVWPLIKSDRPFKWRHDGTCRDSLLLPEVNFDDLLARLDKGDNKRQSLTEYIEAVNLQA